MAKPWEPKVWVVDSAYTGERNARIGVAERLAYDFQIVPLPDPDKQAYATALRRLDAAEGSIANNRPVIVLSGTGEDTIDQIADLREEFRERLFNVFLASILPEELPPRLADYDLIASPQIRGPNVVHTLGIPHRVTPDRLARARDASPGFFQRLRRPVIGLLVGGNTRYCFGFDAPYSLGLARRVKQMASELGGSVVATNSRRTPPAAWTALTGELSGRHAYLVDWRESQPDFYFALLAEADIFVATGDSLSMCSEVCATGKPLLIDLTLETTEPYHRQILSHLLEYGAARLLNGAFRPWSYVPPDPAGSIAEAIRARLRCPPPA